MNYFKKPLVNFVVNSFSVTEFDVYVKYNWESPARLKPYRRDIHQFMISLTTGFTTISSEMLEDPDD